VSAAYSAKIYKQHGPYSIERVKENPYRLARDIHGIGFLRADQIAQHLGIDRNSLIRANAGLLYVLGELTEEGHVYYPQTELIRKAREMLKVDPEIISKALTELSEEREIFIEDLGGDRKAVYLIPFYLAEKGVAEGLKRLKDAPSTIRPIHPEKAIEWVQGRLGIELAEKQKEAVLLAARSKVLIITGGPGTGKTTILTAILKIFQQLKLRIFLAAPTGRAAKRMSEATGWVAKTIHRLLEYAPQKGAFKKESRGPSGSRRRRYRRGFHDRHRVDVPSPQSHSLPGPSHPGRRCGSASFRWAGECFAGADRFRPLHRSQAERDLPPGPGEHDRRQRPPG
jgi:exodeoxyribonuclease V alpha subunit